jgi:hypothetical protein
MSDPVTAVYELREAAVNHGKAIADAARTQQAEARDLLLVTSLELEQKTAHAVDECAEDT